MTPGGISTLKHHFKNVTEVALLAADSPAAKAGLKAGDVVIAVNSLPVDHQNDLRSRVAAFQPNDEVTLTVVKGTANGPIDQHDVKVTLAARPAQREFQLPPGLQPGTPGLDSREG